MELVKFCIRRDLCENLQKLEGHEFEKMKLLGGCVQLNWLGSVTSG